MNLNHDVVYRCPRLGPLGQLHAGRPRGLIRHHYRLHDNVSSVIHLFAEHVPAIKRPLNIECEGPWAVSESEGGTA
jgi:hypothetical protein